jgi:hypothetical protein
MQYYWTSAEQQFVPSGQPFWHASHVSTWWHWTYDVTEQCPGEFGADSGLTVRGGGMSIHHRYFGTTANPSNGVSCSVPARLARFRMTQIRPSEERCRDSRRDLR